jgi:hypothetical protein
MLTQADAKSRYTFDAGSRVIGTEVGVCTSGRRADASLGSMADSMTPSCMVAPFPGEISDRILRCRTTRSLDQVLP